MTERKTNINNSKKTVRSSIQTPTGYRHLDFARVETDRLTHYLFRFPAKFHPPVVHSLIQNYTTSGQRILDPFCGSGTLLLAAAIEGRLATGSDVDPVAVFVTKVKTHRFQPVHLHRSWTKIHKQVATLERATTEYDSLRFSDISLNELEEVLSQECLWTPTIPNLLHWFRKYVVVDLARILKVIREVDIPETHREFFRLVFASIIRNASNADPVPVSGLEVTAHMKRRDAAGRLVNPFALFFRGVERGLSAVQSYRKASSPKAPVTVFQADARRLSERLRNPVDAIITSPPYNIAVDYYRRHQLEMYWLGFTNNHAERLQILPHYIGRYSVRKQDPLLQRLDELGPLTTRWYQRIREACIRRADAFGHYMVSMKDVYNQLAEVLQADGLAIFVLGHSKWNGMTLPTSDLFEELADGKFQIVDRLWYPIKNRYMSYGRRNGADIGAEHVLVFRRTD